MDELARYNKERWEELARENVPYSRPFFDLDERSARTHVDPHGMMGNIAGKDVLCLAGGGGQQSVALALLGGKVTVLDLTDTQLERDRMAAAHYDVSVVTVQGDMRDLSCFAADAFDIVWQPYSINFVPDARLVFRQVARVLRPDGIYRVAWANPFTQAVDDTAWNGKAYPLQHPYVDGYDISELFPNWDFETGDGTRKHIRGPREFRHNLSTMLNGLIQLGFVLLGVREETSFEPQPEPGTWEHFKSVAAPYLTIWATYRPYVFQDIALPA